MQTLFQYGSAGVSACRCARCGNQLPSADINVGADTALCRACGATYKFSELVAGGNFYSFDPANPPEGASFRQDAEGTRVTGTTRSALAFFLVPFLCVWSGFSLTGIYGSQIRHGVFRLTESLFGIPFLLGTVLLGTQAAMMAAGQVVVFWNKDEGTVFSGVGPIGWMRKFRWSRVQSVTECDAAYGPGRGRRYRVIRIDVLHDARVRSIRFGTLLSEERRQFLLSVLRSQAALHR